MVCFALFSDYSSGFGGKYGVQADRVDKSAMGFDYQGKTEKHESQKGLLLRRYHSKVLNNSFSLQDCKNSSCFYSFIITSFLRS